MKEYMINWENKLEQATEKIAYLLNDVSDREELKSVLRDILADWKDNINEERTAALMVQLASVPGIELREPIHKKDGEYTIDDRRHNKGIGETFDQALMAFVIRCSESSSAPKMPFLSNRDAHDFIETIEQMGNCDEETAAILYILIANSQTWQAVQNYVEHTGTKLEDILEGIGSKDILVNWMGQPFIQTVSIDPTQLLISKELLEQTFQRLRSWRDSQRTDEWKKRKR